MNLKKTATVMLAISVTAAGQTAVKHIQTPNAAIASAVWAGDTLYVSGQLPNPVTPADRDKGTPAAYGDTKTQAGSSLAKIEAVLKEQMAAVQADKKMSAKDKKLALADLNAALKAPEPPIENKGNIDLVTKYYDQLTALFGEDKN